MYSHVFDRHFEFYLRPNIFFNKIFFLFSTHLLCDEVTIILIFLWVSWIWNKKKSWSQNDWEIKEKDDDILLRDTKVFQFNNLIMANESFWREANQMDWQIYLLFNICIYMQLGLVLFFAIFRSFFFINLNSFHF